MKKISIVFLFIAILVLGACGHKHVYVDNVVAPTCTEKGYTEHKCECGEVLKDTYVEALGHKFGEWTVVKEATEDAEGLKERACSVCQIKEEEAIEKLAHVHVFGEWVVVEEATDLKEGLKERTCKCGEKEEEAIEKLEHFHEFGEWVIIEEATTTQAGYKERTCRCGDSEIERISKIIDRPEEGIYVGADLDYDTLAEALEKAQEGDTIILYTGEHGGDATVNVANLTIKGPNAGINANTGTRVEEAIYRGTINVTAAASNLTIDGLAFTENSKIAYQGTDPYEGFKFINNKVYDTTESSVSWDLSRYQLPGFIQFTFGSTGTLKNVEILNNSFINVSEINVLINRAINVKVDGNVFKDFDLDAIRIEGGYAYGDLHFTNNVFEQSAAEQGYHGIFLYTIAGPNNESPANVLIDSNKFINLGKNNETVFTGAIGAYRYQEKYTSFTITNNVFDHCYDYLYLRNNGADNTKWFCNVENNQFLGLPHNQYYGSYQGNDTETTNPHLAVFTNNYYEDNDGNVITDLSAYVNYFKHMGSYGTAMAEKPAQ